MIYAVPVTTQENETMPIEMTCECCKQPFYCYQSDADAGRKYCSLTCRSKHRFNKALPAASRTPVDFSCKECGKPFIMMQSYLTAYRKKFGRDPLYCSMPCSSAALKKRTDEKHKFTCLNCGKECTKSRKKDGQVYSQQKVCSKQCKNEWVSKLYRQKHGLAATTRRIKRNYAVLRIPASNGNPAYEILEHRYVMEQHIGRKLHSEETVHHVNGDRFNNDLSNLELFSSRHGPGQRVIDKVAFAIEMLRLYPEFARAQGVMLINDPHDPIGATP